MQEGGDEDLQDVGGRIFPSRVTSCRSTVANVARRHKCQPEHLSCGDTTM